MSAHSISPEVALRIGLAIRALTDTDVRLFINILIAAVGQPITLEKLSRLRLNRLKSAADGLFDTTDDQELRTALGLLKGRGVKLPKAVMPEIQAYSVGDMADSIRVACSSDEGDKINAHFGACKYFLIYQVAAKEVRLIEVRQVPSFDGDDDKNLKRAELIADCHVLCTLSIGGPAAAKVVRAGLHPMKVPEVISVVEFIAPLQKVLASSPPPWLAKAMGKKPEQRVRFSRACLA